MASLPVEGWQATSLRGIDAAARHGLKFSVSVALGHDEPKRMAKGGPLTTLLINQLIRAAHLRSYVFSV